MDSGNDGEYNDMRYTPINRLFKKKKKSIDNTPFFFPHPHTFSYHLDPPSSFHMYATINFIYQP